MARHEREVADEDHVYVMNIRRGVKWSDGKTMTPADVKYSFDLLKIADASAAPAVGRRPG